jgi:MHS family proline/betaine transporter-like MFS transporter
MASRRNQVLPLLGNLLEWYDFAIYGYLALPLGEAFFPSASPSAALLRSFAVFAVGFLMRPVGSLVLGPMADLYGRRRMLSLSMLLMGSSSVLIGMLPTHAQWGSAASVLMVLLRMLQGFSVGGEYTGSIAFTAELSDQRQRGLFCSLTSGGAQLGIALASLSVAICSQLLGDAAMLSWGWRLPFWLGGILVILALQARRRLPETSQRTEEWPGPLLPAIAGELRQLIRHRRPLLQVMALVCTGNVIFYLFYVFLVTYSSTSNASGIAARTITSGIQVAGIAITVLAGWLVDRYGLIRISVVGTLAMVLLGLPAMAVGLQGTPISLFVALLLITPPMMLVLGSQGLLAVLVAPDRERCGVFSVAYSTSVALFGGTAPLVGTWLVNQPLSPTWLILYPLPFAAVSGWALWRVRKLSRAAL